MQKVNLSSVEHNVRVGDICGSIEPNVTVDSLFMEGDVPIGFYLRNIGEHSPILNKMIEVANAEFNSDRVPKSEMRRSSGLIDKRNEVKQYSTIIGSVPAKANMRRYAHRVSSVHGVPTAQTFIKSMYLSALECEKLIKKFIPETYKFQQELFAKEVPKQWRLGNLFTSSISNFNIAAPFHTDKANIRGCVNVIIVKKRWATGGNTTVPDYQATVDSCDNSMLVYPAWKSIHGVTPIELIKPDGYRNSLVFYPLKAFRNE